MLLSVVNIPDTVRGFLRSRRRLRTAADGDVALDATRTSVIVAGIEYGLRLRAARQRRAS
jgi:hypothetical protein